MPSAVHGRDWLERSVAGIQASGTLRRFLNAYSQEQWPDLLKLTLLYGAISLHKHHGSKPLSIAELREAVGKETILSSLIESLPKITDQLNSLQAQILNIKEELHMPQPSPHVQSMHRNPQHWAPDPNGVDDDVAAFAPGMFHPQPGNGRDQATASPLLYPDWWGDGTEPIARSPPRTSPPRGRAKSMSPTRRHPNEQQQDIFYDPALGSRYYEAGGSSRPWSADAAVRTEVQQPAAVPPQQGPARRTPDPTARAASISKAQQQRGAVGVQSKVQQAVASQRAQVKKKAEQRQRRVAAALGMHTAGRAHQGWQDPSAHGHGAPSPTSSSAADVADQLLANPWTSWLLTPVQQSNAAGAGAPFSPKSEPPQPAVPAVTVQDWLTGLHPTAAPGTVAAAAAWLTAPAPATPDWMVPLLSATAPATVGSSQASDWLQSDTTYGQAWPSAAQHPPSASAYYAGPGASMQVQEAVDGASQRRAVLAAVRPEVARAAKTWVGDFGHLDTPRFPPSKAFSHHRQEQEDAGNANGKENAPGEDGGSKPAPSLNARVQQYMQQFDALVEDAVQD